MEGEDSQNSQQPVQMPTTPSENPITPTVVTQPQVADSAPAPTTNPLDGIFDQIAERIIEQQEAIIGPIAVDQAKLVGELKINWPQHEVDIEGSPQIAIDDLVAQYKELFGQIAVETCREAVANLLSQVPADQQPSSLKI